MKILHISPTYYSINSVIGGGEKYIIYMINAINQAAQLLNKEINSTILAFGDKCGSYTINNVKCEVILGTPWDYNTINLSQLVEWIKIFDVIIVHQCLTSFGLYVGSHASLLGKLVIGMDEGAGEHSIINYTQESGRIYDFFIAYSAFCKGSFSDLNIPIKLILGPVDTRCYYPDNQVVRDKKLIVAVGRLLPHKGFDRIIKALPENLKLIIAGSKYNQEYFNYLQDLIAKSPNNISILENLDDARILELYRSAGLFIHASTHIDYQGNYYAKPELLGLAPLEALACGTPTVVSTAGSLNELEAVKGCFTFSTDEELAIVLKLYSENLLNIPNADIIYSSVDQQYGPIQFGRQFILAVEEAI